MSSAQTPAGGLATFTDPASVAVVGASADPAKWGYWLARGALRGAHRRAVHLVNANGAVVEGAASVPSLQQLDAAAELVVLCAPARLVPGIVDEALAMGTKGFLGITAGIDAVHGPGTEQQLADRIRMAGARIVGPNCLGLYDAAHQLELAWGTFEPGDLAVVSQSGQLGLELAGLAAHAGLGVSRFVSVGNQVDVSAVDVLDDLVTHSATKAVVLYLEGFGRGRDLVAAMRRLRRAGKPVVVLTVGASEASRAAARSHTGALTAATDVVAAACRSAGAVLVQTPSQAVDLAHLLIGSPLPAGRRVAVVSDSGGQGALAADVLTREGLQVPALSAATVDQLVAQLPPATGCANPVDLAGAGEQDLDTYARVVETLLASGDVDSVVLSGYFGCYGSDTPALVDRELEVVKTLAESVRVHGRPVLVHSMAHDSDAVRSLRAEAVPTLHTIDAVARSLGASARLVEDTFDEDGNEIEEAPEEHEGAGAGTALPYVEARSLVERFGVEYPPAVAVRGADDVQAAAARFAGPYVVKAGWLEHKSDLGGVVVGLPDADSAALALAEMTGRLGDGDYVLEQMDRTPDGVELIVGARRDPAFGPVVLVGLGGVEAELYRDVQLALAPVSTTEARRMLGGLRAFPLLQGWRGKPPVDLEAAADAVVAVSRLVAETPEVSECEVNPLRVTPHGAVALDALVVAAVPPTTSPTGAPE